MKLQTSINFFSIFILIIMSTSIVYVSIYIIEDIIYDLNKNVLSLEINNLIKRIEQKYKVLDKAGIAQIDEFVIRQQNDLVKEFINYKLQINGTIYIVSQNGKVLLNEDSFSYFFIEGIDSNSGFHDCKDKEKKMFCAFQKFPQWNWIVLISVKKSVMFEKKAHYINLVSGITFVVLILNILIFTFFSRKFVKRVKATLECTRQIEHGNLSYRITPITYHDEIGYLQLGINSMAQEIEKRIWEKNKAEKKYRGIFQNAPYGIFQTSIEGKFLTVNPTLAKMLKYDSPDDLIKSINNIEKEIYVKKEDRKEFISLLRKNGYVEKFETKSLCKDKSIIYILINAHLINDPDNNSSYFEGFVEDITQIKETEKLRLEKEAAESSNRAKSAFLSHVSHEIRTPMNLIMGYSQLLMETDLTSAQNEHIQKIWDASKSLLDIINDILDFSKIEAGKLHLEKTEFTLQEIIYKTYGFFSAIAEKKGIKFILDINPDVPLNINLIGDPLRLSQVLVNLCSNAIKFTHKGEIFLKVNIVYSSIDEISLKFMLKDSGIGISEEQMKKLFHSFSQGDASINRKYGGTGLGLVISKNLIEAMGGEIFVESEIGKGSAFIFTAKFEKALQIEEDESSYVDLIEETVYPVVKDFEQIKGANILLVEDNTANQKFVEALLLSRGMNVSVANNGSEALDVLQKKQFNVILMDLQMPEMDGYETTEIIRKDIKNKELPIIAMTAHAMINEKDNCLSAGMNDYISKPFNKNELFAKLIKWIANKQD